MRDNHDREIPRGSKCLLQTKRLIWPALLSSLILFTSFPHAIGQIVSVGNEYVEAFVHTGQKSGRFWISAGSKKGGQRYLFHGITSEQMITSNLVFRLDKGDTIEYFCNTTGDFFLRNERPTYGSDTIPFRKYDDFRVSGDTIEVTYKNDVFYTIKVRFVVEEPASPYDNGADILIEFDYELKRGIRSLGIMMMLDGDNGAAQGLSQCGGTGDRSSIITSAGYYPSCKPGFKFEPPFDSIPEFYHIGNFEYNSAYIETNRRIPTHRLRGFSNGGAPLTPPARLAVGDWHIFRKLAWDPANTALVDDVAAAMQWEELRGKGTIRTAFGTNNEGRNNLFQCRDQQLFADIRTVRLIQQESENGPYKDSLFAVEMWLSNTAIYDVLHKKIRLVTPILSEPDNTARAILVPSSPQDREIILIPTQTQKLVWYLKLNPNSADTLIRLQFDFADKDFTNNTYGSFRPFLDGCTPLITVKPFRPPPTDTLAPVITRVGSGRNTTAFWDFRTFDRHPGFNYDTGLEEIQIVSNSQNNFKLTWQPDPFLKCDITETVNLRAEVIDTTKASCVVFRVRDCNGNVSFDSVCYSPRPDNFRPQVLSRDSAGSWDPVAWPCNARTRRVVIIDSLNQFPNAGDYGLGRVEVVSSYNFADPIIIDKSGNENGVINDFDSRATIVLNVLDSNRSAQAEILVTDYAGNDTTLYFSYCTIDDFQPPVVNHVRKSQTQWHITATDSADWDRGLLDMKVISSKNILFRGPDDTLRTTPPNISKGAEFNELDIELANHCDPAELILQYRDTYYDADPANHVTYDTIRYDGIPDTLAPNILIIPGYDGTTYFYEVRIDDIHYFGNELFDCDRGLEDIQVTFTSNLRIRQSLTWLNSHEASLSLEVIDTLAIDKIDTLCITAIDSASNRSEACDYWPATPDGKSPVFIGRLNRSTLSISGLASDNRENDRGLGSVLLRNSSGLDQTFGMTNLRGRPTANVNIPITTPTGEISGELVIEDLYGEVLSTPEQSIHTVVIPFRLPVAQLSIEMPELVDAETEFVVQIRTVTPIESDLIKSITFDLHPDGPAQFIDGITPPTVGGTFTAIPTATKDLRVRYESKGSEIIPAGRLLGSLKFRALARNTNVEPFTLQMVTTTKGVNDGRDTTLTFRKVANDPLASQLTLPPPLLLTGGDTLTYVNGDCNRALTSIGAGKPTGLAILALDPQPVQAGEGVVKTILRDVPKEGATIEWIAPDGRTVETITIQGTEAGITRYIVPIPENAPAGLYFFRVLSTNGIDTQKMIITQ